VAAASSKLADERHVRLSVSQSVTSRPTREFSSRARLRHEISQTVSRVNRHHHQVHFVVRLLLLYTERGLMNNPRRQGPLRDILMPQKCRIVDPTPKYIIGLSCNIYPACSRYFLVDVAPHTRKRLQADFRHGRCCAVSSSQQGLF